MAPSQKDEVVLWSGSDVVGWRCLLKVLEGAGEFVGLEPDGIQAADLATTLEAAGSDLAALCLDLEERKERAKPLGSLGSLENQAGDFSMKLLGL